MNVVDIDINKLIAAEYNPRKLTPAQFEQIKSSLNRFGFVDPVIVNKNASRENVIIGGHQRVAVAREIGMDAIPCVLVDLDIERERELNIRLNKNSGEWDDEILSSSFDAEDLASWGFLDDELHALFPPDEGDAADDGFEDEGEDLVAKYGVAEGMSWELGRHRLICGDSTNADVVKTVMAGASPEIMVTDPPYGVEYDPKWRAEAGINKNKGKMGTVKNDDRADWFDAWALFPGDVAYVYHAGIKTANVQSSLERAGFICRAQIVWAKDRMALSRGDYHWQHEPCWYAVRKGGKGGRTPDRTQTTVWNIPARDDDGHGHGTQKPVECMARAIRNHTFDVVYEPFAGSGTTIMACEALGKTCIAVELDPAYVGLILERYSVATGDAPKVVK